MKESGIALVTGLILLAALSLLALTAASGTVLQRSMSNNYEESELARQNAAVAMGHAMAWLNSRPVSDRQAGCVSDCVLPAGLRNPGELPDQPEYESAAWWRDQAFAAGYNPDTAEVTPTSDRGAEPARWLIEELHYLSTGDPWGENRAQGLAYYRILGRGTGRNVRSVAVIEVIAARPWDGNFNAGSYPPDGPDLQFCQQFEGRYDCGRLSWRQRR